MDKNGPLWVILATLVWAPFVSLELLEHLELGVVGWPEEVEDIHAEVNVVCNQGVRYFMSQVSATSRRAHADSICRCTHKDQGKGAD